MADKMYWATKCTRCNGMVGYRDVRYVVNIDGTKTQEELPVGIIRQRCAHCGTLNDLGMHQLRPTSIKLVVPRLP
jgi:hypothetical protein